METSLSISHRHLSLTSLTSPMEIPSLWHNFMYVSSNHFASCSLYYSTANREWVDSRLTINFSTASSQPLSKWVFYWIILGDDLRISLMNKDFCSLFVHTSSAHKLLFAVKESYPVCSKGQKKTCRCNQTSFAILGHCEILPFCDSVHI